jgi:hypothetical protein
LDVRLYYLQRTGSNVEQLLGASVAALTAAIAWPAFAIIVTRSTKSIPARDRALVTLHAG